MPVKVLKKSHEEPKSYFSQFQKPVKISKKKQESIDDLLWKVKKGPSGRLPTEKQIKLVKKISGGDSLGKSMTQVLKDSDYKSEPSVKAVVQSPVIHSTIELLKNRLEGERVAILDEMEKKRKGANYGTLAMAFNVIQTKIQEMDGFMPNKGELTIAKEDRERIDRMLSLSRSKEQNGPEKSQ